MSTESRAEMALAGSQPVAEPQKKTRPRGAVASDLWEAATDTWETGPATRVLKREMLSSKPDDEDAGIVAPSVPLLLATPESGRLEEWDPVDWEPYSWGPELDSSFRQPNGAGVGVFARRLMARERARARGRQDPHYPLRPRGRCPTSDVSGESENAQQSAVRPDLR